MDKQNLIEILKEFEDKLEHLVDWYASLLADNFMEVNEVPPDDSEMYDTILEMKGGRTVLQNIEALGFEPFKLLEQTMLLCED